MIVVGVDGSPASLEAVRWAADDALRAHAPLRIVHAIDRRPYDIARFDVGAWSEAQARASRALLDDAVHVALERQPGIEVTTESVEGNPVVVLREQARHAEELVVGSRGRGGFAGAVLGSVSMQVAGHAHGTVVVVRPTAPEEIRGEIVVGIDDSGNCEPAVEYAFEQARRRGCALRAIYAWQLPVHVLAPEVTYDIDEVRQAQADVARERLAARRERYPQVAVTEEVVSAHPVDALVDASAKADLVVVGSHGRGAIRSLVLGSVSRGVLHHARCTVAVVRSHDE